MSIMKIRSLPTLGLINNSQILLLIKKISFLLLFLVLMVSVQACQDSVSEELYENNNEADNVNKNIDVCDYINRLNDKRSIKKLFEKQKFIRNGLFYLELPKHDRYGEAKSVLIESVQSTKYNLYLSLSDLELDSDGTLSKNTELSNDRIELVNSVEFIIYNNTIYILTNLKDIYSGKEINVYEVRNDRFDRICQ